VTSSWFFLSTLNYDAWSTTHQIYCKCIFPYSMLLDHNLSHLFEIFEQFSVYTHNTVFQWAVQSTKHSDLYSFPNMYCDIIMQQEPMKYTLFKLTLQSNFSIFDVFYMFWTVLRLKPRGLKHADVKNWKI
jgi:hypothetical protein